MSKELLKSVKRPRKARYRSKIQMLTAEDEDCDYLKNPGIPTPVKINTSKYDTEIKRTIAIMSNQHSKNVNEYVLYEAINEQNVEKVKYVCSELNPDIDFQYENKEGDTPLILAVKKGNLTVFHTLTVFGADLNKANFEGYTPLHIAVQKRNKKIAKTILDQDGDINLKNSYGYFALKIAVHCENEEMVNLLLKYNPNINLTDKYGRSVLHIAVFKQNIKFIKILCTAGININIKIHQGYTALHIACQNNYIEDVKALLEYKPDLNSKIKGFTPIHTALFEGYNEIFDMLFKYETDSMIKSSDIEFDKDSYKINLSLFITYHNYKRNIKYDKSFTELHIASYEGNLSKLKALVGVDINAKTIGGLTPLHIAVKGNRVRAVNFLLKNSASMYSLSDYFCTPFFEAVRDGNKEIIHCFIENNVDLSFKTENGLSALQIASNCNNDEVLQMLIKYLINSNPEVYIDNPDFTNLHLAASSGNLTLVKLLVENGININVKSTNNKTPLDRAIKNNQTAVVKYLLKNDADPNLESNSKFTPLNTAVYYGHLDMIQLLVEYGADINRLSSLNVSPLQTAARCSSEAVLELLLDLGAGINKVNSKGRSALYYAAKEKRENIVEYLLSKGIKVCCKKRQNVEECVERHMSKE